MADSVREIVVYLIGAGVLAIGGWVLHISQRMTRTETMVTDVAREIRSAVTRLDTRLADERRESREDTAALRTEIGGIRAAIDSLVNRLVVYPYPRGPA